MCWFAHLHLFGLQLGRSVAQEQPVGLLQGRPLPVLAQVRDQVLPLPGLPLPVLAQVRARLLKERNPGNIAALTKSHCQAGALVQLVRHSTIVPRSCVVPRHSDTLESHLNESPTDDKSLDWIQFKASHSMGATVDGKAAVDTSMYDVVRSPAAFMAVVSGGALTVSAILSPAKMAGTSLCPLFHLTGVQCPFCGMTRAFISITHADFAEAIDYNPGSPLIYGAFIWMLYSSIRDLRSRQVKLMPSTPRLLYFGWLTLTIPVFAWLYWSRWLSLLV